MIVSIRSILIAKYAIKRCVSADSEVPSEPASSEKHDQAPIRSRYTKHTAYSSKMSLSCRLVVGHLISAKHKYTRGNTI